jgi:hypothetical protein
MQFLIDHNSIKKGLYSGCLVLFVLLLTASPAFSGDAELTNLIVRNNNDELQVDLVIKGVFTEEMKADVSKGIPVNVYSANVVGPAENISDINATTKEIVV